MNDWTCPCPDCGTSVVMRHVIVTDKVKLLLAGRCWYCFMRTNDKRSVRADIPVTREEWEEMVMQDNALIIKEAS